MIKINWAMKVAYGFATILCISLVSLIVCTTLAIPVPLELHVLLSSMGFAGFSIFCYTSTIISIADIQNKS